MSMIIRRDYFTIDYLGPPNPMGIQSLRSARSSYGDNDDDDGQPRDRDR